MTAITPTVTRFHWGPECWQVCNYKAHPTRDIDASGRHIGNPVLLWRHSGGGAGATLDEDFSGTGPQAALFDFLLSTDRKTHFDLMSVETAQRGTPDATAGATGIRDTRKMFMRDDIRDFQRCVASLKMWGRKFNDVTTNKFDPNKMLTGGVSFGASVAGLAMAWGPRDRPSPQRVATDSPHGADTFDSSVIGNIYVEGQIDPRVVGGTQYMAPTVFSAWYGTNAASDTEFNALSSFEKDSLSIVAFLDNDDTEFFAPMFVSYNTAGNHTLPLADAHDSRQAKDLMRALARAGIAYDGEVYSNGSHVMPASHITRIYEFMVNCITLSVTPKQEEVI